MQTRRLRPPDDRGPEECLAEPSTGCRQPTLAIQQWLLVGALVRPQCRRLPRAFRLTGFERADTPRPRKIPSVRATCRVAEAARILRRVEDCSANTHQRSQAMPVPQ